MFSRTLIALSIALVLTGTAQAQPPADPTQQALVQMLGEAQSREAQALVQAYTLKGQIEGLKQQLADATKRAEEAEAKVAPAAK